MSNPSSDNKNTYQFESFRLDTVRRTLLRDGQVVPLTSKRFDILLILVRNRGQVVTKDELIQQVWPDTIVEENNLAHNISALRKALGETPGEHRFIITIPGQGYQFVASLSAPDASGSDALVIERTRSRLVIEEDNSNAQAPDQTTNANSLQPAFFVKSVKSPVTNYARTLRTSFTAKTTAILIVAVVIALGIYLVTGFRSSRD